MKIPDAKAAVDKEWKFETIPAWDLEIVNSKKEVTLEAQRDEKESPLCHTDGHMSPQKCGVRTNKLQKYKGRVELRGGHRKRRLWSPRSLH